MTSKRLLYVYALGDAALADQAEDLAATLGVDGAPVQVIASGRSAAVVSPVDPSRFGEEALRANLEDLGWLEETARAHHRVVERAFRLHPVAPVGLAAVFRNEGSLTALLEGSKDRISDALDRVRGRIEWGVKTFALPAPDLGGAEDPADAVATGPGAAYLMRKRAAHRQGQDRQRRLRDAAEEAHRSLSALAVTWHAYQPQDPRLSGRDDEMLTNVAYLVDAPAQGAFRARVEGWPATAVRLELSGPWAPYSFATLEEES